MGGSTVQVIIPSNSSLPGALQSPSGGFSLARTVLVVGRDYHAQLLCGLVRKLRSRLAARFVGLAQGTLSKRLMDESGAFDRTLEIGEQLRIRFAGTPGTEDQEYVRRLDSQWPFWSCVDADRVLALRTAAWRTRAALLMSGIIGRYVDEEKPDVVLFQEIATFPELATWGLSRTYGATLLVPFSARLPEDRFVFVTDPMDHWWMYQAIYERLRREGFSPEEREHARTFLATYFADGRVPCDMSLLPTRFGPAALLRNLIKHFRPFVAKAWLYYFKDAGFNVTEYSPLYNLWHFKVKRAVRNLGRPRGSMTLPDAPYVYYPLHASPESAVLVRATSYTDQVDVIRNIAKVLPYGTRLVVKEHPHNIGLRPSRFYKSLADIPDVHLASPAVHGHALLTGARAIVTLTGTAGWEAVLAGKPSFILGQGCFYDGIEWVTRVRTFEELGERLRRLDQIVGSRPEDREALMAAHYRISRPGITANPLLRPDALSEENLTRLADAALEYLEACRA